MSPHTAYVPLEDELPPPPAARPERQLVAWGLAIAFLASAAAVLLPTGASTEALPEAAPVEVVSSAGRADAAEGADPAPRKVGCRRPAAVPAQVPVDGEGPMGPDDL